MDVEDFCDEIDTVLQEQVKLNHTKKNVECILIGDFNILFGSSRKAEKIHLMLLSEGIQQVLKTETRFQYQCSSAIDHIFSNMTEKMLNSGTITVKVSDHLPTYLIVQSVSLISQTQEN